MSPRLTATARREQILDVALEVFANAGFHGASMNDIADAAGVTKRELRSEVSAGRLALDLRPGETVRFTGGRFAEATALLLAPVGPVLLSARRLGHRVCGKQFAHCSNMASAGCPNLVLR